MDKYYFKVVRKVFLVVIMVAFINTNAAAQVRDSLLLRQEPIKAKDFRFEPTYYVLPDSGVSNLNNPYHYMLRKPALPHNIDLSFLKKYNYKQYNMGDFIINNSLIDMPFREWGTDIIPYHLKQQTFTVIKKKRDKR
jgi:hypothetical protein